MSLIQLTKDNYFSDEADKQYMSVSQFKEFAGTPAQYPCEDTAYKKSQGYIHEAPSTSLLVGSYVDSYFEGSLDQFKEDNPEIFKKTGDKGLKSDYVQAEEIIARIESDPLMMSYLNGQKQVIMAGEMFGIPWKIKMDAYHPNDKIVDLKVMKDMKPIWAPRLNQKTDFVHYYGYDIQGAVYQKIVEINTGKRLPFYLAVATKEKMAPDIELIEITQDYLDEALQFVSENIEHVMNVKNGIIAPERCHNCFYCRLAKRLTAPISLKDIMVKSYSDGGDEDAPEGGYSLFG